MTRTNANRWAVRLATAGAMAVVIGFFHWTVRSSGGFGPPGEEDYYNFLVQGWRQGQLSMSKEPRPEMRALADPYDPVQNHAVRMGDASYYRGRYYLYFGAGPAAVLLLPYSLVTGKELGTTTAVFVFCVVGYLAACAVWWVMRQRYFDGSAGWVGPLGVLVLGLGTHGLVLLRRPLVWELPIAAAYAFAMMALAAVYAALHGRRPVLAMAGAGLSLGLAVASRPTCLVGAAMLVPAVWALRALPQTRAYWRRATLAAAAGLGGCVLAVLAHNHARFGQLLEFGQNYQLTGVYESKMRHFAWEYVPHNLGIYFFRALGWSGEFPFWHATAVRGGPAGYLGAWNEAIGGIAVAFPIVWLALGAPLAWRGRERDDAIRLRGVVLAAGAYGVGMAGVIMAYFLATPRYAADFGSTLALVALVGLLAVERRIGGRRSAGGQAMGVIIALAGVVTILAGVCLSFGYHDQLLRRVNPSQWEAAARWFGVGRGTGP